MKDSYNKPIPLAKAKPVKPTKLVHEITPTPSGPFDWEIPADCKCVKKFEFEREDW